MSLSELEQTAFAYFTATAANDVNNATRWFPRSELILIMEDKFAIATRKFGFKVKATAKAAATLFVEYMLANGGWETKANEFGGTMHQFNLDGYRKALAKLQADDPIVQQSLQGGETFWADRFAALTV